MSSSRPFLFSNLTDSLAGSRQRCYYHDRQRGDDGPQCRGELSSPPYLAGSHRSNCQPDIIMIIIMIMIIIIIVIIEIGYFVFYYVV